MKSLSEFYKMIIEEAGKWKRFRGKASQFYNTRDVGGEFKKAGAEFGLCDSDVRATA
jgi:hypothetical protein